jgi:hypothetical protein
MTGVHYDDSGGQRGMITGNWLLRGMIAARRSADMGGRNPARRTRALGTRDRVLSCLADGEISDPKGMASTVLAEAVGYPGSSAAFAQLLSGMERSGLIEREIRGKRTYRIGVTGHNERDAAGSGRGGESAPGSGRARADASGQGQRGGESAPGPGRGGAADTPRSRRHPGAPGADSGVTVTAGPGDQRPPAGGGARSGDLMAATSQAPGFDYDELARRLLVQVVRRLAVSPGDGPPPTHDVGEPERPGASSAGLAPEADLQQTVAGLEQKLASVRSRQRRLTAENAKLREQLQAARQSLAEAEERASTAQVAGQLGGSELQLLERLLSATRDQPGGQEEAGAG